MNRLWRNILGLFVVGVIFLSGLSTSANAQVGEHIDRYDVSINIQEDGRLSFVESIQYDFSSLERHGIRRWIPLRLTDKDKQYEMGLSEVKVSIDGGQKVPFKISSNSGTKEIKIGDPDKTITGKHTYEIRYTIAGGMRYFEDSDEFYWNVIGQNWEVPIQEGHTSVFYPKGVLKENIKADCFTGVIGSTEKSCSVFVNPQRIDMAMTRMLQAGEGMSIVVGMPAGTVAKLLPKEYVPFFETPLGKLVFVLGLIAGIVCALAWYIVYPIWIVVRWYLYGRDPDVGIDVTALFNGPSAKGRHLTPAETGGLIDEKVDRRDLIAALVDLARRGYVRIEERESKDFYLHRTHEQRKNDKLIDFEEKMLQVFFADGEEVRIKDVKDIVTELQGIEKQIYARLMADGFFVKDPKKTRDFYTGVSALALGTFNLPLLFASAVFGNAMPRKTLIGARAAQQARGLKNFLESQERQLNYQGNMQLLFEKLLPFAVAFGIEKNWIERFAELGIEIAQPSWYTGQGNFGTSFYSFNSAARASSFTQTTSSSSSSGFSGGSSGGGGGGGGGGSW